jgi:hypothetical protein
MFIKQILFWKLVILIVFTFHIDMKPCDTKRQVTTQKIKWYRNMIKSVIQHSCFENKPNKSKIGRLQNNPSTGLLVHLKSTHFHPLTWGNKDLQYLRPKVKYLKNFWNIDQMNLQHRLHLGYQVNIGRSIPQGWWLTI